MKILLISDSHGARQELLDLFEKYKGFEIIHCGDYEIDESILMKYNVHFVPGNCDRKSIASPLKCLEIDYKKIFITHGHLYNVKFTYDLIVYKALEAQVDYCFFGHTHRHTVFKEEGITFVNPGSMAFAREKTYVTIIDDEIKVHYL